jgi:endonuclease-3 related protein
MKARTSIPGVYHKLFAANGKQHWWPADSAFEIMVGAVLTQNTAWTNVEKAIANLKKAKALSPQAIVKTHPRRLARWLKPSGYFNIKATRLRAMCR